MTTVQTLAALYKFVRLLYRNWNGLYDFCCYIEFHVVSILSTGPQPSKRVRGKTGGKGVDKLIAQNGGEKLFVPVPSNWKSLGGVNAPKATNLLGVYLRMMCPVKNTPTWWHVDQATQSAVIQAVLVISKKYSFLRARLTTYISELVL
jgi:hypothetical protein